MYFDNAYDYLKLEYSRLNAKRKNSAINDFSTVFEKLKDMYGSEQSELYESDKII